MSNRTVSGAQSVHGTDPQLLIEKIVRERIYSSRYWKEQCFGLTTETIIDRALELKVIGGSYGAQQKPTEFLCLLLKLLQLQPTEEIVEAYINAEEHKYLRILGVVYYRFVFSSIKIYKTLEPLLSDFRKVKIRQRDGSVGLKRFDEMIWTLLREEKWFDVVMPRISKRRVLEDLNELEVMRTSLITPNDEDEDDKDKDAMLAENVLVEEVSTTKKKDKWKPEGKKGPSSLADEIEEENQLRAKLGLKPLVR